MAESSSKDVFSKLLAQLAGQLWQLETTLQAQALNNVFSEDEKRFIKTYQDLFDALVAKQRLGPRDLSLLSIILKQQSRRSHLDFLRPFYEAGFGHQGLEDGGRQADKDGPVNPTRPRAFGFIRHRVGRGHKKRPAVCCETRFKLMLHRVGANVNSEELSALKLLCQDAISRRQLESCPDCLDLLTALCKQQCITGKRPQFLYRLLQDCGRQDLTSHIDEYIYVCLMSPGGSHHQAANTLDDDDFDADLNALLKRDRRSQGKNYQFRRSLKKLGDEISQSDLKNMKYISGIPEGKLEAVGNVFDFFLLMEEMGVLSRSNISFLERILDEKVHLIIPFYEKGFGRKKLEKMNSHDRLFHIPIETIFGMNPDMNFKRLIKTIGTRLTSDDVKNLKFLCRDATAACLEEIESGMDLLACLEKSQKISATDIEFLAENLESIGRKDLQKYLTLYKRSTPRSSLTSTSSMAGKQQQTNIQTNKQTAYITIIITIMFFHPHQNHHYCLQWEALKQQMRKSDLEKRKRKKKETMQKIRRKRIDLHAHAHAHESCRRASRCPEGISPSPPHCPEGRSRLLRCRKAS